MESTFKTMDSFAEEVSRIHSIAQDFVAPSYHIQMEEDEFLRVKGNDGRFKLNEYANGQFASRLGIPKSYWDKCREVPGLRDLNANVWLRMNADQGRMVRTLGDTARAFVSDRFLRIDNFPVLEAIFPVLKDASEKYGIEIVSHALSETRMYLQIVFPKRVGEVKVGDVIQAGVTISNSEVGSGAYSIQEWMRRLRCMNGMTGDSITRKYHLGEKIESNEEGAYIYKADTIDSELKTIALKSRDALEEAIKGSWFDHQLDKMKAAATDVIATPVDTVEKTVKLLSLPDFTKDVLLTNMIQDGELNRWGLSNAVTALAHHDSFRDPDKAIMVETAGQQILSLSKREWASLTSKREE